MSDSTTPSLRHLGVGSFAIVMGVGGLATAFNRAAHRWEQVPDVVGAVLAWASLAILASLAVAYSVKLLRYPGAVRDEWRHPVSGAFAATTAVGTLIVATALLPHARTLSAGLWWVGAAGMAAVTLLAVRSWVHSPQIELAHVHPAWFIPAVGNIVAPIAGVEHAPAGLAWYFFGVGMVAWVALLPLVFGRLAVGGPLAPRLTPTLAILAAPPAVASYTWVALGGEWTDALPRVLASVTVFHLLLVATQARAIVTTPFALPAWAVTFPLAASAVALVAAGEGGAGWGFTVVGLAAGAAATVAVAFLLPLTVRGFANGSLLRAH